MNPLAKIIILAIKLYKYTLSPMLTFVCGPGSGCRFTPSCSEYGIIAVQEHGALRGIWLTIKRILRCHPWGGSGYDPVPGAEDGLKLPLVDSVSAESDNFNVKDSVPHICGH